MEPIEQEPNGLDLKAYLPEKWYNALKWINLILIPALVTLYASLSDVLDLPNSEGVAVGAAALMTFMGVLLGASQGRYNKVVEAGNAGTINVTENADGKTLYSLEVAVPPEKIKDLQTLTFGVKSQ